MDDSSEPVVPIHCSCSASMLPTICEAPDGPACWAEMADLLGPPSHDLTLELISLCPVSGFHQANAAWAVSRHRRRPADFCLSFVQDAVKNRQQQQLELVGQLRPVACG